MPDPNRLRFDGVEAYLGAPLNIGGTTVQFDGPLTHAWQEPVPSFSQAADGSYLVMSILDANYRLKEIVHVTDYVTGSDQATIVRGQEATDAASHEAGRKISHVATTEDYLDVQEHDTDPNAHEGFLESRADAIMNEHLAEHEAAADPHPQYIRKDTPVFTGDLVVDGNLTVTGDLIIPAGSTLLVQGVISVDGILLINGYRLAVAPSRPGDLPEDAVLIQVVD